MVLSLSISFKTNMSEGSYLYVTQHFVRSLDTITSSAVGKARQLLGARRLLFAILTV